MAIENFIPRIEWRDLTLTGTLTNGNPTVTGIVSTADVEEGMIVENAGVPVGTTVLSKTTNTIVLSANATSTGSTSLDLFNRFDFRYPAKGFDDDDQPKTSNKVTESLSGKRQVQTNYIEGIRDLEFWFLTESEKAILMNQFIYGWAIFGKAFRYFPDKADSTVYEYELESFNPPVEKQIKKHPGFLYSLKLKFRRVLF